MRSLSFWIGTAMFSLGVIILLIAGGIYAYGLYEDLQYQNELSTATALEALDPTQVPATQAPTPIPPTATPRPTETLAPTPTLDDAGTPVPEPSPFPFTPTVTSTPEPEPTPTGLPDSPQVATRIKIPAIKLDAPVKESVVSNGQWLVPKFAAGHLQGTANPGGPGNAVFAGHVSSISSGNVFANIGKLAPGDEVVFVTRGGNLTYQVSGKMVVRNTDVSVTRDFGDQRATLITCTGRWLPLERDFNQRMVVVAMRVS